MAIAPKSTFDIKITADTSEFEKAMLKLRQNPIIFALLNSGNSVVSAGTATIVTGFVLSSLLGNEIGKLSDSFQKQIIDFFKSPELEEIVNADISGLSGPLLEAAKNRQEEARRQLDELERNAPNLSKFLESRQGGLGITLIPEEQVELLKESKELIEDIPSNINLDLDPLDPEIQKQIQEEIDNTKGNIDEQTSSVDLLNGAIAMAGDGLVAGAGAQSEYSEATKDTAKSSKYH